MGALVRSLPAATTCSTTPAASCRAAAARGRDRAGARLRPPRPEPARRQALALAGSVSALIAGRHHLSYEDVRAVALPALRHRLILTFDAERNGVTADDIVSAVVDERAAKTRP